MIDKRNRVLILIAFVLLVIAVWITLEQEASAQYCHLEWRSYWSRWYGRYVSYPVWCCGWGYAKRCRTACRNVYGGWGPCY